MIQGSIWLINLDPTIGAEIKKTRPCIILNSNYNPHYPNPPAKYPLANDHCKLYPPQGPSKSTTSPQK